MLRSTAYRSHAKIARLTTALAAARWNPLMRCPRRTAIDAAWPTLNHAELSLIYFDLDDLNRINCALGQDAVDRRIATVWDSITVCYLRNGNDGRPADLYGQWKGGDEFIIAVPHAAAAHVAERLQTMLQFVGLSASRAIVYATPDLAATVQLADAAVKAARDGARGQGVRGVLVDCRARVFELAVNEKE